MKPSRIVAALSVLIFLLAATGCESYEEYGRMILPPAGDDPKPRQNGMNGDPIVKPSDGPGGARSNVGSDVATLPQVDGTRGGGAKDVFVPFSKKYEAEEARLVGLEISQNRGKYSGQGYVTGFDSADDSLNLEVNIPTSQLYTLSVTYATPQGEKVVDVSINGATVPSVRLEKAANFTKAVLGKYYLKQGVQTIKLLKGWGYYDIDSFTLYTEPKVDPARNVVKSVVTPNPTPGVKALWDYLKSVYGKKIIAGQVNAHAKEGAYILEATGRTPAIGGFDLLHYTSASYNKGLGDGQTDQAIAWHKKRNGIVTLVWHWFSPSGQIPGKDKFFYTDETTFDVAKAVQRGTKENTEIMADLKRIGDELEKLQAAQVPVLWRPLHEAEGKWFWWGAKGPEACKELYKLMFDYLVHTRKLTNLIWVWTSTDPAWYPGDAYVDIVAADIYHRARSDDPNLAASEKLVALVKGKKLVTLAENDAIPDPDSVRNHGAAWSWFNTWYGEYILTETYNPRAKLHKVYNSDFVITLDELPDLRTK